MEEHGLKIKILSQKHNPLLKRREVVFEVDHSQEGQTTTRLELRKNLSNMLKTKLDLVFVERVKTRTGTTTAIGEANAYESSEQAKLVEREYIIIRNTPPEKLSEEPEKPKPQEPEDKKPTKEEKLEEGESKKKEEEVKQAPSTPKSEKSTKEGERE